DGIRDFHVTGVQTCAFRSSGELRLQPLESGDSVIVTDLLRQHLAETGSLLDERMLAAGDDALARFVKVVPRDFAAVVATRQAARSEERRVGKEGRVRGRHV